MTAGQKLLVGLALWAGLTGLTRAAAPDEAVATVNGETITQAQLQDALKQAGPAPLKLSEEQKKHHEMQVLGALIDQQLMRQFLARHAEPVAPGEVDRKLAELKKGLTKQGKSFEEFLGNARMSEAQMRADIADRLRWGRYAQKQITEEQVKRYYEEYKPFFDQVIVRASHIVLRVPQGAPEEEVKKAEEKLRKIRAEIVSGKITFAEAAKKYSQDATAEKGGDVGRFPRLYVLDEAFAKPAFALKVHEVSDIVRTDFGVHLITVTERSPGKPSEYAKVRELAHHLCSEDLFYKTLSAQRKAAKVELLKK
jgi:peptidyl-prolyl cis-trans isomerase C